MVCQKSNRAFTYRKSRGAHVHVSNEWKWVAWYEDMTTWTFHVLKAWNDRKSIVRILYTIQRSKCWRFDTVGLESNDSSQQMTIRHTGCRFAVSCKSTSGMTGRHFFCYESFDWSRIVSIWQHLQPPIADTFGIYSFLLQTDFRYAFPRHQRWFLRTPTSQHL